MGTDIVIKQAGKGTWGFLKKLKYFFLFIVFFIMFLNAIIVSVKQKDITPGLTYLGNKWLLTTKALNDNAMNILNRDINLSQDSNFFKKIWYFIKNFWGIFEELVIIYIWLSVMSMIFVKFPIADSSKTFIAFLFSLCIFLLVQIIVIAKFTDESMMFPLLAFKNTFLAITSLFIPKVMDLIEQIPSNTTINFTK